MIFGRRVTGPGLSGGSAARTDATVSKAPAATVTTHQRLLVIMSHNVTKPGHLVYAKCETLRTPRKRGVVFERPGREPLKKRKRGLNPCLGSGRLRRGIGILPTAKMCIPGFVVPEMKPTIAFFMALLITLISTVARAQTSQPYSHSPSRATPGNGQTTAAVVQDNSQQLATQLENLQ